MVLASLALLWALVSLWSSLRQALSLAGADALPLGGAEPPDRAALLDEKKSLLRAIKDLEYEHAVGKIAPDDFKRLDAAYRVRAKEVLSLLEQDLAPFQARAEALIATHGDDAQTEKVREKATAKVAEPEKATEKAAEKATEKATAPTDETDLRARARALREEAERLERAAAQTDAADEERASGDSEDSSSGDSEDSSAADSSTDSSEKGASS